MLHKRRADRAKDAHVDMQSNYRKGPKKAVWCEQNVTNYWRPADEEEKGGK